MELWQEAADRLTPAASETLDELLDDVRRQTLVTADRQAYGSEIGVRDVIEAFQQTRNTRLPSRTSRRNRFILPLTIGYAAIGAAATIFAILSQTLSGRASDYNSLIALSGASVLVASISLLMFWVLQSVRMERKSLLQARVGYGINDFLTEWVRIESSLKLAAANLLGESASEKSVSQIISSLSKAGLLDDSDAAELRDLVQVRNLIVHRAETDEETIDRSIRQIRRSLSVVNRLERKER